MKYKPRLSTILLLAFAVLFGWGTAQLSLLQTRLEIEHDVLTNILNSPDGYQSLALSMPSEVVRIIHPYSFSDVHENRYNLDNDDEFDSWNVIIHEDSPLEVYVGFEDTTDDGTPDKLNVSAHKMKTMYGLRGISESHPPTYQAFRISDLTEAKNDTNYTYFDLNSDGKLDMYETSTATDTKFLLLNQTWIETSAEMPGNRLEGFWVLQADGEFRKAIFEPESGEWKLEEG